jgi:hypothetical protein
VCNQQSGKFEAPTINLKKISRMADLIQLAIITLFSPTFFGRSLIAARASCKARALTVGIAPSRSWKVIRLNRMT